MTEKRRGSPTHGGIIVFSIFATLSAVFANPLEAKAGNSSCDDAQYRRLRAESSSWPLTEASTIDKAQRFMDHSANCSTGSNEPQRSSYALGIALGAEEEARALREQGGDFSELSQRASILFQFVAHDKYANQADRQIAETHLAAVTTLK